MLSLALLAISWLQNPEPTPPAPVPEIEQPDLPQDAPAQQQPGTISQQEVEALVAKVSTTFAEAGRSLSASAEATAGSLAAATALAERLVVEMEELLAALPAPPQSPSSGSGSDGKPSTGNQPAQDRPKPHEDGQKEGGQAKMTPLRDMPLSDFLRDPRDGSWGKLPPRLQQTIESASAEEVPLRYRRWLVEYHRQGIKSSK